MLITCGLRKLPSEAFQACCHASEACSVDHGSSAQDRLAVAKLKPCHAASAQAVRTVDPRGRSWNRLKTAINQPDLVSSALAATA